LRASPACSARPGTLHHGLRLASLGRDARTAVAAAEHLVLGRPSVSGLPPAQGRAILQAADAASLSSFHLGIGIAAGLLALGAVIGAVGIRNQRPAAQHS
jgi:hypothetical protein